MKGMVFDIKEFSIHDGPGARVTVFLKGCPLRCMWCHNPEGMGTEPQYNVKTGKYVGVEWESEELVKHLLGFRKFFEDFCGGVTFSGGEPTGQAEFLMDCAKGLPGIHKLLDTSGFCDPKVFARIVQQFDAFYYDIKLVDEQEHRRYTGVSNKVILENLKELMGAGKDVTIRMPMIPMITDTEENLSAAAQLLDSLCRRIVSVHLLPYNSMAGGKYPVYGMKYPLENWYRKNQNSNIRMFEDKLKTLGFKVENYVGGE